MKAKKILSAIFGCILIGFLGTPFTASSIPTWYSKLQKPPLTPPNWLFGPVWTILYMLMGVSLGIISQQNNSSLRNLLIRIFFLQLILNFLWSVVFFGIRSVGLGLVIILALDCMVYFYIFKAFTFNKTAAYIMIPYALWISFATYLNTALLLLNRV